MKIDWFEENFLVDNPKDTANTFLSVHEVESYVLEEVNRLKPFLREIMVMLRFLEGKTQRNPLLIVELDIHDDSLPDGNVFKYILENVCLCLEITIMSEEKGSFEIHTIMDKKRLGLILFDDIPSATREDWDNVRDRILSFVRARAN